MLDSLLAMLPPTLVDVLPELWDAIGETLVMMGVGLSAAVLLGGPLGSVMLGWLMDRYSPHRMLALAYATGAVMLLLMSSVAGHYVLMCVAAFLIGVGFNGGGTGMNALSTNFFPLPARATGNSWMHGIGRTGAIISAFAGAWMLNAGWNFSQVAMALTVPAFAVSAALMVKYLRYRGGGQV